MKHILRKLVCSGLLALPAALSSAATVTCQNPQFTAPQRQGSVFHFSATVACQLSEVGDQVSDIKAVFEDNLRANPNRYKIQSTQSGIELSGLSGTKLDVVEKIHTSYGDMTIASDAYLLDNQKDKFVYSSKSRRILTATGNTKFTQARALDVVANKLAAGSYRVKATLAVSVRKPSLAPLAIFETQTKKGIGSELQTIAKEQAQLVVKGLGG